MDRADAIRIIEEGAAILRLIEAGDKLGATERAVELGFSLIPAQPAELTDEAAHRGHALADAAEEIKTGG